jgi:hypothetical protein
MKPVNTSKEDLLAIIDNIRDLIEINDSFEGQLIYSMPGEEKAEHPFDVYACFRIGNSRGQGGIRMIGE